MAVGWHIVGEAIIDPQRLANVRTDFVSSMASLKIQANNSLLLSHQLLVCRFDSGRISNSSTVVFVMEEHKYNWAPDLDECSSVYRFYTELSHDAETHEPLGIRFSYDTKID